MRILTLSLFMVLFCSSCATKSLWRGYGPNEKVWISADDITERELIDTNVEYQHYYSETGPGYLVKKSSSKKLYF